MALSGKPLTQLIVAGAVWMGLVGGVSARQEVSLVTIEGKLERAEDLAVELEGRREPAAVKTARERELKALEADVQRLRAERPTRARQQTGLRDVDARLDRFIANAGAPAAPIVDVEIPAGVEIDVRLRTIPRAANGRASTPTEAVTLADLRAGDAVVIPAGAIVRGAIVREPGPTSVTTGRMPRTHGAMHFYVLEMPAGTYAVDLVVAGTRPAATASATNASAVGISGGLVPARAATAPGTARSGPVIRLRFDTPLALQ